MFATGEKSITCSARIFSRPKNPGFRPRFPRVLCILSGTKRHTPIREPGPDLIVKEHVPGSPHARGSVVQFCGPNLPAGVDAASRISISTWLQPGEQAPKFISQPFQRFFPLQPSEVLGPSLRHTFLHKTCHCQILQILQIQNRKSKMKNPLPRALPSRPNHPILASLLMLRMFQFHSNYTRTGTLKLKTENLKLVRT